MEPKFPQLPFLTREMLKFGNKVPMRLRLSAAASKVGEVNLRAITRNGIIALNVNTSDSGLIQADTVGIDDIPILVSVVDEGDNYKPNECWANISLEFAEEETISLCSGFVYVDKGITWPAASLVDNVPNHGRFTVEVTGNPAAGDEHSITVPGGKIWIPHSIQTTLVTDATAINRQVHFRFTISTNNYIDTWGSSAQGANETNNYSVAKFPLISEEVEQEEHRVEMPQDIILLPGGTITTITTNLQAGDNFGIMRILAEEYYGMNQ